VTLPTIGVSKGGEVGRSETGRHVRFEYIVDPKMTVQPSAVWGLSPAPDTWALNLRCPRPTVKSQFSCRFAGVSPPLLDFSRLLPTPFLVVLPVVLEAGPEPAESPVSSVSHASSLRL